MRRLRSISIAFLVAALFVFSWKTGGVDLGALFSRDALGRLATNIASMFPPRADAEFLRLLAKPVIETVAIAFLGISGALAIALPLSFFAVRPEVIRSAEDKPARAEALLHHSARTILSVLRTVPEVIWALMFVHALGLGTVPGVLAIAFSYAGVLGKVFAEIFESVNRGPPEALRASGTGKLGIFVYAILPQAFPLLLSYSLYRFDCALRSSAVLGLVGAGGLGFQIELSIKMLEYGEVLTELAVLFALVALSDLASARIRAALAAPGRKPGRGRIFALGYAASVAAAAWFCGLGPTDVFAGAGGVAEFFIRAFPPETSSAATARFLRAGAETVGISLIGTALALAIALPLAVLGARRALATSDELLMTRARAVERAFWLAAALVSRAILNILRTIPMVIFALLFVPAIGIGPFAGVLAIACHTAGVFGRIIMEMIDEVNPKTLETFRGFGARRTQVLAFAIFPQTAAQTVSFFFYRWEANLRESVILGIVGGGGIGQLLYVSINLFHEHETYALILLMFVLVATADAASASARRWVLERSGERREVRPSIEAELSA